MSRAWSVMPRRASGRTKTRRAHRRDRHRFEAVEAPVDHGQELRDELWGLLEELDRPFGGESRIPEPIRAAS